MLIAAYDGYHWLDLQAIFQNIAWTNTYSGYTDDPLVQCISNFRKELYQVGVVLEEFDYWKNKGIDWQSTTNQKGPYIFVVSGYPRNVSLSDLLRYVATGSHLVIILPRSVLINDAEEEKKWSKFVNDVSQGVGKDLNDYRVVNYGLGRVFLFHSSEVDDLGLEPGPFGGPLEAEKSNKHSQLRKIAQDISTFEVACIDCQISSMPASWPLDETLVIEIVAFNKSLVDIEHATLNITFLPTVEPLSTNFIDVYELKAGSMRSVALLAAPREKGSLENPVQIAVIYGHLVRSIFLPNMKIQVLGNLHKLLRFSESSHIDLKTVLNRYSDYLKPFTTPSALINLANNDPDAAIIKIRKLGEHISKSIASRYIPEYKDSWNFADVTKQLYDRQVIGAKAKGYIDHIRILGNQAAHPSITTPVQFDNEDAFQGCYALALFIKEIVT